jgi:hypothetical protein
MVTWWTVCWQCSGLAHEGEINTVYIWEYGTKGGPVWVFDLEHDPWPPGEMPELELHADIVVGDLVGGGFYEVMGVEIDTTTPSYVYLPVFWRRQYANPGYAPMVPAPGDHVEVNPTVRIMPHLVT